MRFIPCYASLRLTPFAPLELDFSAMLRNLRVTCNRWLRIGKAVRLKLVE